MMPASRRTYLLCPDCDACPGVEIRDDGTVAIGEAPHITVLTSPQWNVLVKAVQSGVLGEIG